MKEINIGIIGLDTSHSVAFTKLLNDTNEQYHVKNGEVTIAFPGGSPDFELSISRVEGFKNELKTNYNVEMTDSIEKVAKKCDAILLESVDGAQHLDQLLEIISYQKPIFIDKPFSLSSKDAKEMIELSQSYQTPLMSTSALRFAEGLRNALDYPVVEGQRIIGADCFGPMEIQEKQPGYFWYGIHAVEMLFRILGRGSNQVTVLKNQDHDLLTAEWEDGRIGTVRGNRKGNPQFGAVIHFENGSEFVSINSTQKPFYASLLDEIMIFFESGVSPVPLSETREIIRFIEAANESRISGETISI